MSSNQQSTTDIVLRSSDGELFYTWKLFLSLASPVFRDLFTLPQSAPSNNATHDGHPVVDLAEDSTVIAHILLLCQPPGCTGKQFKVNSVQELQNVLEVTAKYEMENLRSVAVEELKNPLFLRKDPLGIYILACQYAFPEAAQSAAKHTLVLPTLMSTYVPGLEKITGGQLCRLILYREACMSVACSLARDHTWIVYSDFAPFFGCNMDEDRTGLATVRHPPSRKYPSGRVEEMTVHTWWLDYMRKAEEVLQRSPHGDAVRSPDLVDEARMEISCSKCKDCERLTVLGTFQSFVDVFAKEIDRRVAKVEINVGF